MTTRYRGICAVGTLCVWLLTAAAASDATPLLKLPPGFQAELFADDDLAHDIHSLTIDAQGRVVVSGPGYIRILIDGDQDGRADAFHQFADRPATGSQGMFFLGSTLLCSGDEGLLLFRDADGDDTADGPPQTFLRISAGGEHHVHSIQQGPDGWWYIIAGNFAGVSSSYASLPTSPIRNPQAGVLLRLAPKLSGGEVVADGFRNAYDFAFTPSGDVMTFDSDGERDISLPWYQPTRVFHVLPGSHAGWITTSWKRPSTFADMPPTIAEFGRGSPTGVVCYQHEQFPEPYRGAVFALDWTNGRIFALPLTPAGSSWSTEPVEFAAAEGQFGFAPTDADVGPDGSLYISIGGRGTRGGVFRVTWQGENSDGSNPGTADVAQPPAGDENSIDAVLRMPQPLSAWARARWVPAARGLGVERFRLAAADANRTDAERTRAVEILVELFGGPDRGLIDVLARSESTSVRARCAWALGRSQPDSPNVAVLGRLIGDSEPAVQRCALEALAGVSEAARFTPLLPAFARALNSNDRFVRLAAAQVVGRLNSDQVRQLSSQVADQPVAFLWLALGTQLRPTEVSLSAADTALSVLEDPQQTVETRRDAVRVIELALGDVGPVDGRPAMFDSYGAVQDLEPLESRLNPIHVRIAALFPTGDELTDYELVRVIAMTSPFNRELLARLLAGITEDSSPASDIHRLAAVSRFRLERSFDESTATARGLLNIDVKVRRMGLRQDSNWDDRMGELYTVLCEVDPALPQLLVDQQEFGDPGHVLYLSRVPQPAVPKAIAAFVRGMDEPSTFSWSNELVFLIGESELAEHRALLRAQLDNRSVRDAVLMVLSERPERDDRTLFLSGLESTQLNAVEACAQALTRLPRSNDPAEQYQLLAAARRLINDEREFRIRETVMRLLQNNLGQSHGFVFGTDGHRLQPDALRAWQEYLQQRFPDYRPPGTTDIARQIYTMLPSVDWDAGDAESGKVAFERLSCAKCHGGRKALGPDLAGIAKRFSRDDLFAAIVEPDRDVSSRYQTTSIVTTSGKVHTGLIVYQSVEGLLLRDAEQNTWRFEQDEVESEHRLRASLMPSGLLKDVSSQQLADLYAYLRSL